MKDKNPTSIRFEIDKLKFIQEKEQINSRQAIVDFLIDGYWNMYNPPRIVFQAPQMPVIRQYNDEQGSQVVTTYQPPKEAIKSFAYQKSEMEFLNEIAELQYEDEYKAIARDINEAFWLPDKVKQRLLSNMRSAKM